MSERIAITGFVGGSETGYSLTFNDARTVNLYIEQGTGTPKAEEGKAMPQRPILRAWSFLPPRGGPVRALFHQDGRMFGVSDRWLYEIFQSRNVTVLGEMETDSRPATISSNGSGETQGNQLFITSGGAGYIFDLETGVFEEITDDEFLTPSVMGLFSDSSFINLQRGTNQWQISDLYDGLSWNGLNIGSVSTSSDSTIAMAVLARQLWLFGSKTTQPWQTITSGSTPYAPIPGVFIEHGIIAVGSIQLLDNTLYWLGQDIQGRAMVWRANGYTPENISTPWVVWKLQQLSRLDDILAFSFQFNGGGYYCLYSPLLDTTLVYNINNNVWTEWAHWDEQYMRWVPLDARCVCAGWNRVFFGSRQSGCIYTLEPGVYEDTIFRNTI